MRIPCRAAAYAACTGVLLVGETRGFAIHDLSSRIKQGKVSSTTDEPHESQLVSYALWPRGSADPPTTIAKAAFARIQDPDPWFKPRISPPSWDVMGNMASAAYQHPPLVQNDDILRETSNTMKSDESEVSYRTPRIQVRVPFGNMLQSIFGRRLTQDSNNDQTPFSRSVDTRVSPSTTTAQVEVEASTVTASKCPVSAFIRSVRPDAQEGHSSISRVELPTKIGAAAVELLPMWGPETQVKAADHVIGVGHSTKTSLSLSPIEQWMSSHMDSWYQQSQEQKCPFWRRRSGDALDAVEGIMKRFFIRKDRLHLMGPPQACRNPLTPFLYETVDVSSSPPTSTHQDTKQDKHRGLSPAATTKGHDKLRGLSIEELEAIIRKDWRVETGHKGYYVTGRLTTEIYTNDCYFDGPDPDMPIRGLRKYVGVANRLFDTSMSECKLLSLNRIKGNRNDEGSNVGQQLVAHWELQGALRLPWKPALPKVQGTTTYHVNSEGLIERHEETWDISAVEAFAYTFLPKWSHGLFTS